jgi:hypothetical protein
LLLSSAREIFTKELDESGRYGQAHISGFGRGDIPAILAQLAENVEWETEIPADGVP